MAESNFIVGDYGIGARLPSSLDRNTNINLASSSTQSREPASAMRTCDVITTKLTQAFTPQDLRVADESHLHAGHIGSRPGGETHFRVYIVSHAFDGKTRLERHRMINATLAAELSGGVHALAIEAKSPTEAPV